MDKKLWNEIEEGRFIPVGTKPVHMDENGEIKEYIPGGIGV